MVFFSSGRFDLRFIIQTIDNLYKAFCSGTDCLINKIEETDFVYEKMCLLQEFKEKVDYLVLYQGGEKLIKDDICTLCEQPIESKEKVQYCDFLLYAS